jgi:phosphatidylinositol alpha-1,6-mannosyltransferase
MFPQEQIFRLPVTQQASLASVRGVKDLLSCYWAVAARSDYPPVDLVHSLEAYPTGLVGSWLARRLGCPHALTAHGTYGVIGYERRWDRLAYSRALQRTGLVCPVSNGTAALMQSCFGKALAHSCVRPILNGNDFYTSVSRQEAFDRTFPPDPVILSVGDIKPRKGQHLSLAAFARVKEQFPASRYLIAGKYRTEQPYYQQLRQFIADHKLQDVHFTGMVPAAELRRYYQEASLFVLAPQQVGLHFEGFGLVYLEAGAYGLPVVATRSGGVPDAVKDGETGLLAGPGDVDGIAAAMLRLLGDPDLARQMGRNNRVWAETLTWERNAREHVEAYQDFLARERRPA